MTTRLTHRQLTILRHVATHVRTPLKQLQAVLGDSCRERTRFTIECLEERKLLSADRLNPGEGPVVAFGYSLEPRGLVALLHAEGVL